MSNQTVLKVLAKCSIFLMIFIKGNHAVGDDKSLEQEDENVLLSLLYEYGPGLKGSSSAQTKYNYTQKVQPVRTGSKGSQMARLVRPSNQRDKSYSFKYETVKPKDAKGEYKENNNQFIHTRFPITSNKTGQVDYPAKIDETEVNVRNYLKATHCHGELLEYSDTYKRHLERCETEREFALPYCFAHCIYLGNGFIGLGNKLIQEEVEIYLGNLYGNSEILKTQKNRVIENFRSCLPNWKASAICLDNQVFFQCMASAFNNLCLNRGRGLFGWFSKATSSVKKAVSKATNVVSSGVAATVNKAASATKSVVNAGIDSTKNVANKVISNTKDIVNSGVNLTKDVAGNVISAGTSIAQTGVDATKNALQTAVSSGKEIVNSGVDATKNIANNAIATGTSYVNTGISGASNVISTGKDIVNSGIDATKNVANNAIATGTNYVNTGISGASNVISTGTDIVRSGIDATKDVANNVISTGTNYVNTGLDVANNAISTGKDIVNSGVDATKNIANNVITTGTNYVNTGMNVANNAISTSKDIVNSGIDATKNFAKNVVATGTSVLNKGINIGSSVGSVGKDIVNSGVDFSKNAVNTVTSTGTDIVNRGMEVTNDATNAKASTGENIVNGGLDVANGVVSVVDGSGGVLENEAADGEDIIAENGVNESIISDNTVGQVEESQNVGLSSGSENFVNSKVNIGATKSKNGNANAMSLRQKMLMQLLGTNNRPKPIDQYSSYGEMLGSKFREMAKKNPKAFLILQKDINTLVSHAEIELL